MRYSWIYDRLMIVAAIVLALSLHGGVMAFGADVNGAGGSTVIYSTGGGLGEGYVPRKHKQSAPRNVEMPDDSFLDEGYVQEKTAPSNPKVKSTTTNGSTVIYSTGGGLGEGYVPHKHKKRTYPIYSEPSEEDTKPVKSTVIYTTGVGQNVKADPGSIAPGGRTSKTHPAKGFFHRLFHRDGETGDPNHPIGAGPVAISPVAVDEGVKAASEALLSERRARRSFYTSAAGSEGVEISAAASSELEDEQYLEDDEEFDDIADGEAQAVADPLEGLNRVIFTVNDRLYFWFFRPVALGYNHVVPEPGRVAVKRFFTNVFTPVRFANNLFQLKFKYAGIELERFVINSTIGVAGFMDPAKSHWNLEMHDEDFGQTLGFYGMGPGVYINLPVYGPSNIRDTIGMVADIFLSPTAYILPNDREIMIGINAFERLNAVSLDIGLYEGIKRDALDPYIFIRNAYQQHRESLIKE